MKIGVEKPTKLIFEQGKAGNKKKEFWKGKLTAFHSRVLSVLIITPFSDFDNGLQLLY